MRARVPTADLTAAAVLGSDQNPAPSNATCSASWVRAYEQNRSSTADFKDFLMFFFVFLDGPHTFPYMLCLSRGRLISGPAIMGYSQPWAAHNII